MIETQTLLAIVIIPFLGLLLSMFLKKILKDEFSADREESSKSARSLREEVAGLFKDFSRGQNEQIKSFEERNEKQLEKMRSTVEEKLQSTLEKRLSESFKQVSENLGRVHEGLGEMRELASGVGDLKKVLGNVKTRGVWGEVQLENILEDILTPDQYEKNFSIKKNLEAVDFVAKLPGRYLPIDAKFPREDYERLIKAQEEGDKEACDKAAAQLETAIKREAKSIGEKYISPPKTTDFAILFLPTEGLYAEVLRRPGLSEFVLKNHRVVIAGPTNFAAVLNALSVGFRTLAIQKRSSEVWKLLEAVKTQFGAFSGLLDNVQQKIDGVSKEVEKAAKKSKTIEKKLLKVESLPGQETDLLP